MALITLKFILLIKISSIFPSLGAFFFVLLLTSLTPLDDAQRDAEISSFNFE